METDMNAPIPENQLHNHNLSEGLLQVSLMDEPLQNDNTGIPVLELLAALRKYHQQRDFSHQERFGSPDRQSRQALSALDEAQHSLRKIAKGAGDQDVAFIIEASLNVRTRAKPHR